MNEGIPGARKVVETSCSSTRGNQDSSRTPYNEHCRETAQMFVWMAGGEVVISALGRASLNAHSDGRDCGCIDRCAHESRCHCVRQEGANGHQWWTFAATNWMSEQSFCAET